MLYWLLFLAGFIMMSTPGPVFVANMTLVATQGRLKGIQLISGALIGDMLWLFLTCLFIIEANRLPVMFLSILAIICTFYIFYLAHGIYKSANDKITPRTFKKPFVDGLMLGVLNPKSYPVFIAVFSALVFDYISQMAWSDFPAIFLFSMLGFITSYGLLIFLAGFKPIKTFFQNNHKNLSYLFAAIFVYFGINLLIGII